MALFKEAERICRELRNVECLVISLVKQTFILSQQYHHHEALNTAEEAYKLASGYGYTALAQQILLILEKIRRG
jgi:hypothetical protein